MLIRELSSEIIEKYCGFYDKYNFSLCHLKFKRDAFQLKLLFTYHYNLCEELNQCKMQNQGIVEAIEKAFYENLLSQ